MRCGVLAAAVMLTACDAGSAPPVLQDHDYVANTLSVPQSAAEVTELGLDLDGDPQARPDNQLGAILATLAEQDLDVREAIDEAFYEGTLILLSRVRADFVRGGEATWQLYLGEATVGRPDLGGAGEFVVSPDSPTDAVLAGLIDEGRFTGGPGEVQLDAPLVRGTPAVRVHLVGTKIAGSVSETACEVVLGGALTQTELDTVMIPAWAERMNDRLVNAGWNDNYALTLGDLFDANDDYMITAAELRENSLIQPLWAPDVDLFDESGAYNPRADGVADSLSFGLKLTCVGATFTP